MSKRVTAAVKAIGNIPLPVSDTQLDGIGGSLEGIEDTIESVVNEGEVSTSDLSTADLLVETNKLLKILIKYAEFITSGELFDDADIEDRL